MEKIVDLLNKKEYTFTDEEKALYHKVCSEVLLMAANEKYKLNLDSRFFSAVFPFGGGMQIESVCGSLTGAIAALGLMYTEEKPSDNRKVKNITRKFIEEFKKEFGSLDCAYIKKYHRNPTTGCDLVKVKTALILEEILNEEKNKKTQ